MMTQRVGGNAVLKNMPRLWRGGEFSGDIGGITNAAAVNYGNYIVYGNVTFTSDTEAMKAFVHETAHNWDSSSDMSSKGINGSYWNDFSNISWRDTPPSWGSWEQARDTRKGGVHDDWFNTNTGFAREYGKHNPKEDWATSWEYYFFNTTQGASTTSSTRPKVRVAPSRIISRCNRRSMPSMLSSMPCKCLMQLTNGTSGITQQRSSFRAALFPGTFRGPPNRSSLRIVFSIGSTS